MTLLDRAIILTLENPTAPPHEIAKSLSIPLPQYKALISDPSYKLALQTKKEAFQSRYLTEARYNHAKAAYIASQEILRRLSKTEKAEVPTRDLLHIIQKHSSFLDESQTEDVRYQVSSSHI